MWKLLKQLFGGGPPAAYVDTVNNAAAMLGYPVTWSNENPTFCHFVVEMEGRRYLFVMHVGEDEIVTLGVHSHIRPNHAVRNELAHQNQRLSCGKWLVTAQDIQFYAEVPWRDLSFDRLSDSIHTMVSQVAAFDTTHLTAVV